MKRVLLLLACSACDAPEPHARPSPQPAARYFLNEPFRAEADNNAPSCRIVEARRLLAESANLPYRGARVRADVPAIDLSLSCETAQGSKIASRDAWPLDAVALLVRGSEERAPRPNLAEDARDHLLFEVPSAGEDFLPSARRYDAASGRPVLAHEHSVSRLRLTMHARSIEIALRQRQQDPALDDLLDRLVSALSAQGDLAALAADAAGEAALKALAATYADVRARFQPARVSLERISGSAADAFQITLSLSRPRTHAHTLEVTRLELGLARRSDGSLGVRSFDNRASARVALECGALEEKLHAELRETTPVAQSETCNALGTLLPGSCNDIDAGLLARALEVGARCGSLFHEVPASKTRLPDDLQLTMRRGRGVGALDRSPRYVVALFHQGQVVFHGKHWVSRKERSDGRTQLALLSGLYDHVRRLDWFERRGGHYAREGCAPSDDTGDVITVRAAERERMVVSRDGCRGPFSEVELTDLRRHIELVAGIAGWTEPRPAYIDADIEHWAVAE